MELIDECGLSNRSQFFLGRTSYNEKAKVSFTHRQVPDIECWNDDRIMTEKAITLKR